MIFRARQIDEAKEVRERIGKYDFYLDIFMKMPSIHVASNYFPDIATLQFYFRALTRGARDATTHGEKSGMQRCRDNSSKT